MSSKQLGDSYSTQLFARLAFSHRRRFASRRNMVVGGGVANDVATGAAGIHYSQVHTEWNVGQLRVPAALVLLSWRKKKTFF